VKASWSSQIENLVEKLLIFTKKFSCKKLLWEGISSSSFQSQFWRAFSQAHFEVKFRWTSWDRKMRNLFNIGKEKLSFKKRLKKRKIRKEKKLPNFVFRPAHELSLNWDDVTEREFSAQNEVSFFGPSYSVANIRGRWFLFQLVEKNVLNGN
jgi:hypothetical protein